ncbi:MAG TPA: ribosome-associated translation inhibitor RaiA [Thermoleophilia bacterium]|nr:ribosome-associated translation inhibitor RaiA [Thermoleophilia bacterium]HQG03071.1 ribosome-associated translation inhibitor RaiA [Thermoleophilia bacterium]HQJ97497.1 ribosome-associated translation inhibitor RaiA [Thermoleophilia bacterium]
MKTQIKGRNVTVTDALRDYAEEKVLRVRKLLQDRKIDEVTRVELELKVEKNPSIPEPCVCEATIFTRGPVIRAKERATDMYAAIDLATDKLLRRVKKYHDRVHGKNRKYHEKLAGPVAQAEEATAAAVPVGDELEAELGAAGDNGRVVKTKQFALKPMSVVEATLQLELVGHDFFVFTNAETNRTNVVYRRNDGHYGLIEPAEG